MSSNTSRATQDSPAYRSAFAFHLRVCNLTPKRGGAQYRTQLERASFRVLMILADAAAWSSDSRAPQLCPSVQAYCFKMETAVRALKERGFVATEVAEQISSEAAAMHDLVMAHLKGRTDFDIAKDEPSVAGVDPPSMTNDATIGAIVARAAAASRGARAVRSGRNGKSHGRGSA